MNIEYVSKLFRNKRFEITYQRKVINAALQHTYISI